ncbi:hypothetical protein AB0F68_01590 [Micromonospora sp. NPDC023966]|uniref:hypothetical protein n=1 Tax=Micromonospora sp. NPDC023966 TaxID=3154699 RepID=UPI0033DD4847
MRVVRLIQVTLVALLAIAVVAGFRDARDQASRARGEHDRPPEQLVLGPTGIGELKLGMSSQEATATGDLRYPVDWAGNSTCSIQTAGGVSIHFSRHHGLAVLSGPEQTRTPEGIRAGASVAEVFAAYPRLTHPEAGSPQEQVQLVGYLAAPVPTNRDAVYIFIFALGGTSPDTARLQLILLSLREQGEECTHAG